MKLPKVVAFSLTCLGGAVPAWSQGTLANLANSIGSTIFPLYTPEFSLRGPDFRVEVFLYDAAKPDGFGLQLGSAVSLRDNGRFNAGNNLFLPEVKPGDTAQLIVRTWDATQPGGELYSTATQRWVTAPFATGSLGGDPTGLGKLPPLVPGKMVSGLPGGFDGSLFYIPSPPVGTFGSLANSLGDSVVPVFNYDGKALVGPAFKAEVFLYDGSKEGGFGRQLGTAGLFDAKGVFNAGNAIVPGTLPGDTTSFVVRAWDVRTGSTFDAARVKGISPSFQSPTLGGDPDGAGPLPALTGPSLVSGLPGGFQSFSLAPPPGRGLLASLANNFGPTFVPIYNPDGKTPLAGDGFKVEVFSYDRAKPGGLGEKLGGTVSPDSHGLFNAGSDIGIPGTSPGATGQLILRAWDASTGLTYATASIKGTSPVFTTGVLGGDPDGGGVLPTIPAGPMVSGLPGGFQSFSIAPPPGMIATLSNNQGATIAPIYYVDGTTKLAGVDFKVEVFTYDAGKEGGFGIQLGQTVSPSANFRFNAGNNVVVPGGAAGTTATLIVRAWDSRTGLTYDIAGARGSSGPFASDILGGDPDGDGPLPTIAGKTLVSGLPEGFHSFSLGGTPIVIPGPGTIGLLANSYSGTVVPIFGTDGHSVLAGDTYKVQVLVYDSSSPGGFGRQLGETVSPAANGSFNAGTAVELPETKPGATATLIVRAWDASSGATYDSAKVRGASTAFTSDVLGGDPDGDGPLPATPGKSMTSGKANGFQSFALATVPQPPAGGPGTIATLSNNRGGTIVPIYNVDGTTVLRGAEFKVEVFEYDETKPGGFGSQLGFTVSPAANGRFNAGANVLSGIGSPGGTGKLIVRAWDSNTGDAYDTALIRGNSGAFISDILGGDTDGDGPLLPITGKTLVSGLADGFQSFSLVGGSSGVPEPGPLALGAIGAAVVVLGGRHLNLKA